MLRTKDNLKAFSPSVLDRTETIETIGTIVSCQIVKCRLEDNVRCCRRWIVTLQGTRSHDPAKAASSTQAVENRKMHWLSWSSLARKIWTESKDFECLFGGWRSQKTSFMVTTNQVVC